MERDINVVQPPSRRRGLVIQLQTPNRYRTRNNRILTDRKWVPPFYLDYLREFLMYTSQHGYKYIAQPKGTVIERVFWTLIVLTAIISAVFIMGIEWNFHLSRYTITSVDTAHYPLWNIPFPAVTICGFNKVQRSLARKLIEEMLLPEGVTKDHVFDSMKHLMELLEPSEQNKTKLSGLQAILDLNNITVNTVMKRVSPECGKLLARCSWKGRVDPCTKLFRLHKTYEGYCCSFNYIAIKEEIYKLKLKDDSVMPLKTMTSGYVMGLTVHVRNRPKEYFAMNMASFGVKVLVHDPYDYPDVNTVKKIVSLNSNVFLSIPPWVTYATPEVRDIPIRNRGLRGCLFPDEEDLRKMKRYSYNNCITECRENYTIEICGCTPFYYPNNGGYRTCNLTDVSCLATNKRKLEIMNPGQKDFTSDNEQIAYPCNCLPDCMNYYYPIETSEGILTMNPVNKELFQNSSDATFNTEYNSIINVFFSNFMVTRYRRDVLYSWKGLLASLGGLLSLFIGFSLIGAIEILYFFTLRLYYKMQSHATSQLFLSRLHKATFQNIRRNVNPEIRSSTLVYQENRLQYTNWGSNSMRNVPECA